MRTSAKLAPDSPALLPAPIIAGEHKLLLTRSRLWKRVLDVALASVALLLTSPAMLVAAIVIVLRDPGPWRYVQIREGRGGRPFKILKLRTMYEDADVRLHTHLTADPEAHGEWHQDFKLSRDPRVIPGLGMFLRRWSLDECPQFWNVVKGDMSLVGPRALPEYHLIALNPAFRTLRQRVRPGVTGLWQVTARGTGSVETLEALDSHYIHNWSIWMDLSILARTIAVVVTGHGAR